MTLTDKQQQAVDLRRQGLSQRAIGEEMGVSRRSVRNLLERAEEKDVDPSLQEVMDNFGTNEVPDLYWAKDKKFSALFRTKKVKQDDLMERLKEAFQDIPIAPAISAPDLSEDDLISTYPLFDVHLELHAAANVSGEESNLQIAVKRLKTNMATLMARTPNSGKGIIINGGDFTEADNDLNQTPKSKNPLDVSARNYNAVDASVEVIDSLIQMALQKHKTVEYYSVPGNHDPNNWVTIMFALYNRYRDNPRVRIEKSPLEFSIIQFGKVLIVIHHGDKRAIKDLIMFFTAEYPQVWSGSKYRYLWTGHNHHLKAEDFPGMEWEQFRPVTTRNHYAYSNFYASISELMSITFHVDEGEKDRRKERL